MSENLNQRIVLAARPQGLPVPGDFRLEETPVPQPGAGEVLMETLFLSLDPYMRGRMGLVKSYAQPVAIGGVMVGGTVSKVVQSRHPDWQEGDIAVAYAGWQRFALSDGSGLRRLDPAAPLSAALGALGMPGFTAYAGLRNIGKPKPGETVAVAAATGPVGSAVGQIARIHGARAVGITTGAHKLAFARDELGFDAVVDHKAPDFTAQLAAACPQGIDVYFENVGGTVWDGVFPLLNPFARVPVCGLIAQYNHPGEPQPGPDRLAVTMREILSRSLTLRGFVMTEFWDSQQDDFLRDATAWAADGRLRWREDIVQGLENAPEAFIGLLQGRNFGKLVVQLGAA
ncbi:NADP-dependent oxidoreductase [Acidisoma silvae]|uniref:NADP-dependent oxidoreductase n=1 Tax=Acidisoma silvae TaxID=2802396 RepID=A0A964E0J6_9PROT|nr:NADP-dependent oxidoreductase [Acidisoma silvae]MCB8877575.1 NADP-dependent oxidoreductase [Acidisoma silvae]